MANDITEDHLVEEDILDTKFYRPVDPETQERFFDLLGRRYHKHRRIKHNNKNLKGFSC
jgi:hypothetical protein